ncbi:MAG TPA: transposase, partial [Deltaproteobacteria bacterium]|nr:transposase [Deltaproteobacteria bacterium]
MDRSPYVPLPSSFEEYLLRLERKERHELRRKIRRAEETVPGISFRVTRTREEFDRDF